MDNFLLNIRTISAILAEQYNLDLGVFFAVYILSFIPFYLGYFFLIYGSTRILKLQDVLGFKLRNKLQWNSKTRLGMYIHLFGRVMPYAYILIFGRNLSIWVYIFATLAIIFVIGYFFRNFFSNYTKNVPHGIQIIMTDRIIEDDSINSLWRIYNLTFERVNKLSPCKQSFDSDDFSDVLKDTTVRKYLIIDKDNNYIGIGLVTNDFKNIPWISKDYFKANFLEEYSNNQIFYFMGLAVDNNFQKRKYSILLIEYIIDDLPHGAIMGFDHSKNINPMLHHFTSIVRQSSSIKGTHIDRQHYHVVRRK